MANDVRLYYADVDEMIGVLVAWENDFASRGEPEHILDELLKRETLKTIPVKSCHADVGVRSPHTRTKSR